jgi:hypothetical protein
LPREELGLVLNGYFEMDDRTRAPQAPDDPERIADVPFVVDLGEQPLAAPMPAPAVLDRRKVFLAHAAPLPEPGELMWPLVLPLLFEPFSKRSAPRPTAHMRRRTYHESQHTDVESRWLISGPPAWDQPLPSESCRRAVAASCTARRNYVRGTAAPSAMIADGRWPRQP